jgi:hypothetical protein
MGRGLKEGDRVRLMTWDYYPDCRPGDKGTILQAITSPAGGTHYHLVVLDKDDPARSGVVFRARDRVGRVRADGASGSAVRTKGTGRHRVLQLGRRVHT